MKLDYSPKTLILSPLLGTMLTLILYGATCMQTYQYYTNECEDSFWMKLLVAFVFILESAQAGFAIHHIEYNLVEHYGDLRVLKQVGWSIPAAVICGFIIAWTVNQFFVRRIYYLSKRNLLLSIIISLFATVRPAFGIAASVLAINQLAWERFEKHVQWALITGLSVGLVADCLITCCVSFHLLKGRRTIRPVINALLRYTINTGAILSIFAILELVTLVLFPRTLIFLGIFQVQIQLYANCFLTTLNARQSLREETSTMGALNLDSSAQLRHRLRTLHADGKAGSFTTVNASRRASDLNSGKSADSPRYSSSPLRPST